jgi:hypothetical protein
MARSPTPSDTSLGPRQLALGEPAQLALGDSSRLDVVDLGDEDMVAVDMRDRRVVSGLNGASRRLHHDPAMAS